MCIAAGQDALCVLARISVTGLRALIYPYFSSRLSPFSTFEVSHMLLTLLLSWSLSISQPTWLLSSIWPWWSPSTLKIVFLLAYVASKPLWPRWLLAGFFLSDFLRGWSGFCPRSSFLLLGGLIDSQDFNHYLSIFSWASISTSNPDLSLESQTLCPSGVPLPFQLQHVFNMISPCSWIPAPNLCPW